MQRVQQIQQLLDGKGCGHLLLGIAGVLMFLAFCPLGIIAIASPYWTMSSDSMGGSMTSSASLWTVSATVEVRGQSVDSDVDMCSDEQQGFDDCGLIHGIRFLTITTLLLSCASAAMLLAVFSPLLNSNMHKRRISIAGVIIAGIVLFGNFLSVCLAASVDNQGQSLNGAGFVCLILELITVTMAVGVWLYHDYAEGRLKLPKSVVTTSTTTAGPAVGSGPTLFGNKQVGEGSLDRSGKVQETPAAEGACHAIETRPTSEEVYEESV